MNAFDRTAFETDFVSDRAWTEAIDGVDVMDDMEWEPLPGDEEIEAFDDDLMSLIAHRPSRHARLSLR